MVWQQYCSEKQFLNLSMFVCCLLKFQFGPPLTSTLYLMACYMCSVITTIRTRYMWFVIRPDRLDHCKWSSIHCTCTNVCVGKSLLITSVYRGIGSLTTHCTCTCTYHCTYMKLYLSYFHCSPPLLLQPSYQSHDCHPMTQTLPLS